MLTEALFAILAMSGYVFAFWAIVVYGRSMGKTFQVFSISVIALYILASSKTHIEMGGLLLIVFFMMSRSMVTEDQCLVLDIFEASSDSKYNPVFVEESKDDK